MGFWNKEFKYSYPIRLVLAAPKVLALPYINTTQRYKDTEINKNFVFYFAFHSLIRTFAGIMEYMSQEGYDKLVAEFKQLETVELPQVREAIAEARDKGDLSENFEYHAAKREQSRLLGRIRFKQRVLENARVIDTSRLGADSVGLLSKVEMTNLGNNARMTYTIASPHEANLREGKISIKSPIAQALLNKKAGDVVEVRVPAGLLKLRIEKISLA